METNAVLMAFGLDPAVHTVRPYGSGHINWTYLVAPSDASAPAYVLQRINTNVFKQPKVIAQNLSLMGAYLSRTAPDYVFPRPLTTVTGAEMHIDASGCWRVLPYIADTITIDKADLPRQAFEAAQQFGRFARMTADMGLAGIQPAIPDFHNLTLRQTQFETAVNSASPERRKDAAELIANFNSRADIVDRFERLKTLLPDRLMHHDTKISNALLRTGTFDGVAVCDLDTIMAGKVISDLGDMVRTYVCPVPEDEPDLALVQIRDDYYAALTEGYLSEMRAVLTSDERDNLFFAGEFMIYMQGIRFLADYLNDDVYYPVKYPRHNRDRASNQWVLLSRLTERRPALQQIIDLALNSSERAAQPAARLDAVQ
jgi:hypothetical protein